MSTADKFPDWFSITAKPNFEAFLIPLAGQRNFKCLQLGVYTGDASVWLLENVLTGGVGNTLIDVDTWEGSDEAAHESLDFNEVFDIYCKKVLPFRPTVNWFRKSTFEYLVDQYGYDWADLHYDFIYVDADHTTVGVLLDAELSWPLLKSGGIMAFDDYTWGEHLPPHKRPKLGIDLFLERHIWEYEVLVANTQVWIRKV